MPPILAILFLILSFAGPAATAKVHAIPSEMPGHRTFTAPAKLTPTTVATPTTRDENTVLTERDAEGRVTRIVRNPEADTPLSAVTSGANGPNTKRSNMLSSIMQMIVSLAIVLGTAYLILLGIRKYKNGELSFAFPGTSTATSPKHLLSILETLSLGPGRSLHIIAVGTRYYLIAQTAQQITLLQELSDDESLQAHLDLRQAKTPGGEMGFLGVLTRLLPQHPNPTTEDTPNPSPDQSTPMTLAQFVKSREHKGDRP